VLITILQNFIYSNTFPDNIFDNNYYDGSNDYNIYYDDNDNSSNNDYDNDNISIDTNNNKNSNNNNYNNNSNNFEDDIKYQNNEVENNFINKTVDISKW
jgi:hypothetical protein